MVVFNRVPWSCDPQRAQLKLVRSPKGARVSWNGDSPKSSTFLNDFPWNKQSSYSAIEVSPFSTVSWTCPRSSPLCFGGCLVAGAAPWPLSLRHLGSMVCHCIGDISILVFRGVCGAAWKGILLRPNGEMAQETRLGLPKSFAQMAKWHKKLALAYHENQTQSAPSIIPHRSAFKVLIWICSFSFLHSLKGII